MMKKFWRIMLCIGLVSSAAIAYEYQLSSSVEQIDSQVINFREVDSETLKGIMEGQLPHLALEISEGESIPLKLSLKGDFVELSGTSSADISVKQTLYFRNVEGKYQFRTDSTEWKSLSDFLTGSAQIALGVEEIGNPFVSLGAELYEKK